MYPPTAWKGDEIVADYHLLPQPLGAGGRQVPLQLALAPPFAPLEDLEWHTVADFKLPVLDIPRVVDSELRAQVGQILVDGASFPARARPMQTIPVVVHGYGVGASSLSVELLPTNTVLPGERPSWVADTPAPPTSRLFELEAGPTAGSYQLVARDRENPGAVCGWLARPTGSCVLGEVEISGAPLPAGATNFADKIALLDSNIPATNLEAGGQLPVELTWQSLSEMDEDYTLFLQVLDSQDRIAGQLDTWPLQGTYRTSQWPAGEILVDPQLIPLAGDLAPGEYRLVAGWYLLATLQRLPVLDASGAPVDDRVTLGRFIVP
jgi:hypothetical protein